MLHVLADSAIRHVLNYTLSYSFTTTQEVTEKVRAIKMSIFFHFLEYFKLMVPQPWVVPGI